MLYQTFEKLEILMNTVRYMIRAALSAAILLVLGSTAYAQVPFTVQIPDSVRTLGPVTFTTFEVFVRNTSPSPINVRLTRTVNDLPDGDWYTSLCSQMTCYDTSLSVLPAETIPAGDLHQFKLHVFTGNTLDTAGRVVIRFDMGEGTEAIEKEVLVHVVVPPAPLYRIITQEETVAGSPVDTTVFEIVAVNNTVDTMALVIERMEEYFPDSTWSSSLCIFTDCYDDSVSAPPPYVADDSHAGLFKVRVAGVTPGTGRVVVRLNTLRGTTPVIKRFTVVIAAPASVTVEADDIALTPYPNPARDYLLIPVGGDNVHLILSTLRVFSADGSLVASYSGNSDKGVVQQEGALRLDLGVLASGSYFYELTVNNRVTVQSFVVAR